MTRLPFHTLDVFTATPYTGNPLALVLDADGLSPAQMQIIAREFNLSETIFVRRPADPAHTAEVRIFLPEAEIPFAGHPTIGCAIFLAERLHGPGDWTCTITLEEQAGLVPVTVTRQSGRTTAELTAPVLPHAHPGQVPADLAAAAFGLPATAIGFGTHRPGVWSGGPTFAYIPLADRAALAAARLSEPACSALAAQAGTAMFYLYTPGTGTDFQARMFSPGSGVPEDPATGSATAILAAQLRAAGAIKPGTTRFTLLQGAEMGRPSRLTLTIDADAQKITAVRVAGTAVHMSEGSLQPPTV
ncbi:MAG: PhzF family phenazine biosynthesis protein [Rhodobacterales bacterium]|nr:PhzF family phenazine biosynthesis protein [Rhodobacterales bacterium]